MNSVIFVLLSVAIWLKSFRPGSHGQANARRAMSLVEGEWVDGEVASTPCTSSGCPVVWQVLIGETLGAPTWADFKPHESFRMDGALLAKDEKCKLECNGNTWTISFKEMVQINDESGTKRPIRRTVIVKPVPNKA